MRLPIALLVLTAACAPPSTVATRDPSPVDGAGQLLVVTTASWDATTGTLRRYERGAAGWTVVGAPVAVVVGRTGLAWDDGVAGAPAGDPRKREGDGRAPAGVFPVDTVFGFAAREPSVRMPYLPLAETHDCVDDRASAHYNTTVDRSRVQRVDWTSAERMRSIPLYRLGVMVGYNRPPRAGRGSCIFLHVWDGPRSVTAGCTAMDEAALRVLAEWLDPARRPLLVQLTEGAYAARRGAWRLP